MKGHQRVLTAVVTVIALLGITARLGVSAQDQPQPKQALPVAGCYLDANYSGHGFLRARDGTLTSFDVPGQGNGVLGGISCVSTIENTYGNSSLGGNPVLGINPVGTITGSYFQPISEILLEAIGVGS